MHCCPIIWEVKKQPKLKWKNTSQKQAGPYRVPSKVRFPISVGSEPVRAVLLLSKEL